MSRALVTGGAGFIGGHLSEALLARGDDVVVVDSLTDGGRRENVPAGAKFVQYDLSSCTATEEARLEFSKAEVIYHLAAVCSVQKSIANPKRTQECGEGAFLNVLGAALAAGTRRVVLASSASVYGNISTIPIKEHFTLRPISPYGASKAACEMYARAYCELGLDCVSLRFFNVFGPRQDSSSPYSGAIAKFADRMKRGQSPVIYGDGLQTRDFCHVSNVVEACILAGNKQEKMCGSALNVGSSVKSTVLDVVAGLNEVLGTKLEPIHEPAKAGDPRDSLADISFIRRALGYEPKVGLKDGLRTLFTS